eukprot:gnl/Trimastix_PCT/2323.p1 GENE.gnl/Trimastix_PCT/2323~~gnl/Trimastix_PCT/2323.p1  ORF type:complete len:1240 (+),score=493.38 gnl/Trimastix_PCT/2323:133-3852(+)
MSSDLNPQCLPSTIHVKFETSTNRAKCLSFHPSRTWILVSLHNGKVQMWDWRLGQMLFSWDDHDGPVRACAFHHEEPLFVTGGDDRTVRLWDYKRRTCVHIFSGHQDYIRTVQFHRTNPWILTASDDQTVKIWDYKRLRCVHTLTGHHHYVMCARFHPTLPLVASASLDNSIRIWDISGVSSNSLLQELPQKLASFVEHGVIKMEIDYHDRGVNWVDWNRTGTLLASGSDDKSVRIWRIEETNARSVRFFSSHMHNVSCVLFHPLNDHVLLSNSEDKTIRVWSQSKNSPLVTMRKESDRFWCLATHPNRTLFAAGHDSGFMVFRMHRERPPFALHQNKIYVAREHGTKGPGVYVHDLATSRETYLGKLSHPYSAYRELHVGPLDDQALLLCVTSRGRSATWGYDLVRRGQPPVSGSALGRGAWYGRKYCIANKPHELCFHDAGAVRATNKHHFESGFDYVLPGPPGHVLVRSGNIVSLFDVQRKAVTAKVKLPHQIRKVFWSADYSRVALMARHYIFMTDRTFSAEMTQVFENLRVKSGVWDDTLPVFLYTTVSHLKYALPNGQTGLIRSLQTPVYLAKATGPVLLVLTPRGQVEAQPIEPFEYQFKHALLNQQFDQVKRMMRTADRACGQSIVDYLRKNGFPEIALALVRDDALRFDLALESGNIEIGLECARAINDAKSWNRLAEAALMQGRVSTVEMCYQQTRNFEKLSFLYLMTGNIDKLRKMLKIAEARGDVHARFHNALYLGLAEDRAKVLRQAGSRTLADTLEHVHGLTAPGEEAGAASSDAPASPAADVNVLDGLLDFSAAPAPPQAEPAPTAAARPAITSDGAAPALLLPPFPLARGTPDWPLLQVSQGYFAAPDLGAEPEPAAGPVVDTSVSTAALAAWGDDDDDVAIPDPDAVPAQADAAPREQSGWGDAEDDLDIPDVAAPATGPAAPSGGYTPATPGPAPYQSWLLKAHTPAAHGMAASFETAMNMLHQHTHICNFEPLQPFFRLLALSAAPYVPGAPSSSGIPIYAAVQRGGKPVNPITPAVLGARRNLGLQAMTDGQFNAAQQHFRFVLQGYPFLDAARDRKSKTMELLHCAREYTTALIVEHHRKTAEQAPERQLEQAALFTHLNLQPVHTMLGLRQAMNIAFKMKNYRTALGFASRLLELAPPQAIAERARKVVAFCQQNQTDALQLNYDPRNPFVPCVVSFVPIYAGSDNAVCPHCGAHACTAYVAHLCPVCTLSKFVRNN